MNTPIDSILATLRGCSTPEIVVTAETRNGGDRVYVQLRPVGERPSDPVLWCRMQNTVSDAAYAAVRDAYKHTRSGFRGAGRNQYMLLDPR